MPRDSRIFSAHTCDFLLNGQVIVGLAYYSYIANRQEGFFCSHKNTASSYPVTSCVGWGISVVCLDKLVYYLWWEYVKYFVPELRNEKTRGGRGVQQEDEERRCDNTLA